VGRPTSMGRGSIQLQSRRDDQEAQHSCLPGRRPALVNVIAGAATALLGTDVPHQLVARAEQQQVLRTTKASPEIPKVLAVMLLRTTYDSVEGWGAYSSMAEFQRNFAIQLFNGFRGFKGRYENYDLSELYNNSRLMETRSGGVTNRFYFCFLNDAQWRVIGKAIRRKSDRTRFSRLVGDRLYRSILKGEELKADVSEGSPGFPGEEEFGQIGTWPKLNGALLQNKDVRSLKQGAGQLLSYLQDRGYCMGFELSDFKPGEGGSVQFVSFVLDPVNLDATASLMRSNDDFVPRYDQRILQAYFADCGFAAVFEDSLSEGIASPDPGTTPTDRIIPKGVRSVWTLKLDADASL